MSMLECSAIVLASIDYSEHDQIVKLISAEHGLISAIARGARRAKSRKFAHSLDIGNIVQVSLIPSKSHGALWKLKEANLKKACHIARRDLYKTALITYACEVIYALAAIESPEPKLYGLLATLIKQLNIRTRNDGFTENYRIAFELKALSFAGLMPTLRRCVACTHPLTTDMRFYIVEGGLFHSHCLPKPSSISKYITNQTSTPEQPNGTSVPPKNNSRNTLYDINEHWRQSALQALYTPLEDAIARPFPSGPKWLFSQMLEFHRQKPLKSKLFLREIQNLTQSFDAS